MADPRRLDTSTLGPVRIDPEDVSAGWVADYARGERFEAMPLFTTRDMVRAHRAGRALGPPPLEWQLPYRSIDAAGSPDSAWTVGREWIEAIAREAYEARPDGLSLEYGDQDRGVGVATLYRGTVLLACATVFRDEMNHAVLIRWRAPMP